MLVATVHSEQDLFTIQSSNLFFFPMSTSRHSDLERLVRPSVAAAGSDPPDRLGGLDDVLEEAMVLSEDTNKPGLKSILDVLVEEDEEKFS